MSEEKGTILAVSPHAHVESYLTGSTLANMIDKAKELGRDYFAYTDNGHISSLMKAYNLCKPSKEKDAKEYQKRGLQLIPGIEIYFKDSNCPFVVGTEVDRCKYFTATLYCKDQDAFQALAKLISSTSMPTIDIYEEKHQVWCWKDLEFMSQFNVSFVAGGIHCMVGKPMLAGRPDVSMKIFQKLKDVFKTNFWVCIITEPWAKKWSSVVEITYEDGTKQSVLASDMVSTDKARKIKVLDLIEKKHHKVIKSIYSGLTFNEVNKPFRGVKLHKGFLPLPGGDPMLKINKLLAALAHRDVETCVLASDYAYYATKEDKVVQTMILEGTNKLYPNLYMKDFQEIGEYLVDTMKMDTLSASCILQNNRGWAKEFEGFKLKYKWRLADVGPDPIGQINEIIKKVGRMRDEPIWNARLEEEMNVIARNGVMDLSPYFLPICGVLGHYRDNGILTGPLRGSCGGSLLCYLMGITHVDPFEYDLPFNRFFSMDRVTSGKLPDIDSDLSSRTLLVGEDGKSGYIYGKYGNKCSQISTRNTVRLKTAIKDTNRFIHGKVEEEIEIFTKSLPPPQQGVSDQKMIFGYEDEEKGHVPGIIDTSKDFRKYIANRPDEWNIVEKALGITRSYGVHPAAFILCDEPIENIVPLKDGTIAQYEMKEVEAAGLIKYDFLVVKQLEDIEACLNLINKKNRESNTIGNFRHGSENVFIWNLPKVPDVFKSVWGGATETIFQINTKSMTPFVQEILPGSIDDLGVILALVRPGPLDFIDEKTGRSMAEEYCLRRKGQSEVDIPILGELIPETFGIFVYQEALTKIAKELGGFPGDEAEKLRENMGKKKMSELVKMKPKFIEGASTKVSPEVADEIWERMVTFGRYGFNKSHSIGYALITYACMFLKHFYPMEWWASVLSNATEKEITTTFWPFVKDVVLPPDINLSGDMMVVDYGNQKLRAKLGVIKGMGAATIDPVVAGRPYVDIQDYVNKEVAGDSISHKLIHIGVLDSLFPNKITLAEKLKLYEDAVQNKTYADKVQKAKEEGKKLRSLAPKASKIPEGYLNLHPMKDAAMKKSVLPTMPINIFELGKQFSKVVDMSARTPVAVDFNGHRNPLVGGNYLERLDQMDGNGYEKDIYVAATAFVLKVEEFNFSNNTKKALKVFIDADGYISEKVMWPNYDSGQLEYPMELKKDVIATFFFKKRVGKKDMSIVSVVVES